MLAYQAQPNPRHRNVRIAKNASERRRTRASRARYSGIVRFSTLLGIGLFCVMAYMMLIANLTGLNYAVARGELQRATLESQTARLDDQLARLQSDDRLSRIAAQLHMRDPQQFAVVTFPQPEAPDRTHVAFLSSLTSWFGAK